MSPQPPSNMSNGLVAPILCISLLVGIFYGIHRSASSAQSYTAKVHNKAMDRGNTTSSNTGDYVPLVPYNNTDPNGGDSLIQNLNVYYEVS